ncbi:cuticle protein AM1239-like [Teleopsis dalmanni]|uniref:cuticle protein AM1239-like n=1 Tax=Teleopsis dalmanni TaxID=139649 RepID=UPI0018CE51BF|nr:cuticle protein AM1239-like [Teleopsis dalmanni]XP_037943945.1 cuticle protein AM1239-like [Teleopsis dalmanni]
MAKLIFLAVFALLAIFASTVSSATTSRYDDRGRYNPYHNDHYRYYKNREYYNRRQHYDTYFKQYNPDVVAQQARIVAQEIVPNHDGTYSYNYETENGIHGEEHGVSVRVGNDEEKEVVEGSYSFVTPEGIRVVVKYTADDNGFHPVITYDGVNSEQLVPTQQPADVVITRLN